MLKIEAFGGDTQYDVMRRAAVMALRKNKVVEYPIVNTVGTDTFTPQQARKWMNSNRWVEYLRAMEKHPYWNPRPTGKELKRLVPNSAWKSHIRRLKENFQEARLMLKRAEKLRAQALKS